MEIILLLAGINARLEKRRVPLETGHYLWQGGSEEYEGGISIIGFTNGG